MSKRADWSATSSWRWYGDERTRDALAGERAVLLLGSYRGYPNFGDILQLKGALRWHAEHTGLAAIPVCDADAIRDARFPARLAQAFTAAGFLFRSSDGIDLSELGLEELTGSPRASHLHVYGGGFLNRYWGRDSIATLDALHERFGVGHYVLSGQQIGPELADPLAEHFARHRPLLAGGRDAQSVELLKACGAPAADSFDDAAEAIARLSGRAAKPVASARRRGALIHLNLSDYARTDSTRDAEAARECFRARLGALREWLEARGRDAGAATLLQAYSDRRVDVIDTLGVVQELEDDFPFDRYRVVDLARRALDERTVPASVRNAEIALVSSYHLALLCAQLGVPCFLQAENDYYTQKRLGLAPASDDFEAFLAKPRAMSLRGSARRRARWSEQLEDAYRTDPAPAGARRAPRRAARGREPRAWQPKRGRAEVAEHVADLEARARASESEAARGRDALAEQLAERNAIAHDLEVQLLDANKRAERNAQHAEQLQAWARAQTDSTQWLTEQRASWEERAHAAEQSAQRAEQALETALDAAASERSWLETQRSSWETRAAELEQLLSARERQAEQDAAARHWLDAERARWQSAAEEREQMLAEQRDWLARLESVRGWLSERRDEALALAAAREDAIQAWENAQQRSEATAQWLAEQRDRWRERAERGEAEGSALASWCDELQTSVTWLEGELAAAASRAEQSEAAWSQQQGWTQSLAEALRWLDEQRADWMTLAEARAERIAALEAWARELDTARGWLDGQLAQWMRVAEERQSVIEEQREWIADLERTRAWLDAQRAAWSERATAAEGAGGDAGGDGDGRV